MNSDQNLKESFEQEIEQIKSETVLSPEYRKKKIIIWAIRTLIAIILYVIFWKYNWVRWTLYIYIPLNLFGLLSIFGWNLFLKKKIKKTASQLDEFEK